jgi:hypothetical protein
MAHRSHTCSFLLPYSYSCFAERGGRDERLFKLTLQGSQVYRSLFTSVTPQSSTFFARLIQKLLAFSCLDDLIKEGNDYLMIGVGIIIEAHDIFIPFGIQTLPHVGSKVFSLIMGYLSHCDEVANPTHKTTTMRIVPTSC